MSVKIFMRQLNFCTEIYMNKNSNSNITNIKDIHLQKLVKKSSFLNIKKWGELILISSGFLMCLQLLCTCLLYKGKMLEY